MQIDGRSFLRMMMALAFVAGVAAQAIVGAAFALPEPNLFHAVGLLWAAFLGIALLVLSFKKP